MDWKQEAADTLREYEARHRALGNIPAEIRRLEMEYTAIRSTMADGMPRSGQPGRREDAMLNNIALREELGLRLEETRQWVAVVEDGLASLEPEERLILEQFYVHREHGHVERLMDRLNVESKAVYKKKDKALRRFTLALYGVT